MALVEIVEATSTILWSIVGVIGALLVLWALWQVIQVVRNVKEYGDDYVGYMRGEIKAAAEKEKIDILHPTLFHRDRTNKFRKVLDKENMIDKKGK